jgi:hypothetical protein
MNTNTITLPNGVVMRAAPALAAPPQEITLTLPKASSVPSISSSAVLVELSISKWTASIKDKDASKRLADEHGAKRSMARAYKTLIESPKLEELKSLVSRIYNANLSMTMDWAANLRLLTTANYMTHVHMMTSFQQEFDKAVDAFIDEYRWALTQTQVSLGDLFNPADYPSESEVRKKFGIRLAYTPVPGIGDWRLNIGTEAQAALEAHYEKVYAEAIAGAMNSVVRRVVDALTVFSRQLSVETGPDGKEVRGKIYDGTIDLVRSMLGLMETCNITGDAAIQQVQRDLTRAFDGIDSRADLKNEAVREETKRAVDAAIAALPSLDL